MTVDESDVVVGGTSIKADWGELKLVGQPSFDLEMHGDTWDLRVFGVTGQTPLEWHRLRSEQVLERLEQYAPQGERRVNFTGCSSNIDAADG